MVLVENMSVFFLFNKIRSRHVFKESSIFKRSIKKIITQQCDTQCGFLQKNVFTCYIIQVDILCSLTGQQPPWGIVPRWNTPGGPRLVTYLALTTFPSFSKPGRWRSTLLPFKALLKNFYLISVSFIVLSIELYESNISPGLLVRSLWKMRFWH